MTTMYLFAVLAMVLSGSYVQGQGRGSIRLFNQGNSSAINTAGIVEIYYDSKWTPVCSVSSFISYEVADTVCRQLGHSGGEISSANYGSPTGSPEISISSCDSSTLNLLACDIITSAIDCDSSDYIAVDCSDSGSFEFSGSVRLTGQRDYTGEGLVEVYCNSEWGLICRNGFVQNDANTICRQLGYTESITITTKGSSSGRPVWFNEPGCGSSTQCISSCSSCPSSSLSSCSSVVVTCSYESNTLLTGTYEYCILADSVHVVAIVIGCLVAFLVCVALAIAIPLLICCCLGVGIGAAAGRRTKYIGIS